jgi:hypothetical protein
VRRASTPLIYSSSRPFFSSGPSSSALDLSTSSALPSSLPGLVMYFAVLLYFSFVILFLYAKNPAWVMGQALNPGHTVRFVQGCKKRYTYTGGFNVSNLTGIKRRMIDIGKYLSNFCKCLKMHCFFRICI